jgi:vitamin B12 transporter
MNKKFLFGLTALLCIAFASVAQEDTRQYELDEVVVSASRMGLRLKSIPQKVEIINRQKIETIPADNVADLLKRVTNLDIIQYPGTQATVGMRGFQPTHSRAYTSVLLNGLPSGTINLATIPTAIIERIEVIKGPYAVLYGTDAMGGVINIITRRATHETAANVTLRGGSFGTTAFEADASGMLSDRVGVLFGFSNQTQQNDYRIGSNNLLGMSDLQRSILGENTFGSIYPHTTFQMSQLFGKLDLNIDNQWSASLSSFYTMGYDIKVPGSFLMLFPAKKDINRFNLFGSLAHTTQNNKLVISPYFSSEKNAHYETEENVITNFINFRDQVSEYGIRINNTHTFSRLRLLVGVDYDVWDYQSDRLSAIGTPATPFRPNHRNQRLSAFSQINYEWENLIVNAGARAGHIRYSVFGHEKLNNEDISHTYFNIVPSVGIRYNLPRGFNVQASVGQAFSVPDAFAIAGYYEVNIPEWFMREVFVGNPDLRPETSTSYEFGIGYSEGAFHFNLTYFNTAHRNKIVTERVFGSNGGADSIFYRNANRANMSGLELMGAIDFGRLAGWNQRLELYGNFTRMFNSTSTFTENDADIVRDLLFVRRATGGFGIFYDNRRGFSTRLHARYAGSRLERDMHRIWDADLMEIVPRPGITNADYHTGGGWEKDDKILRHAPHLIFDYSVFYNVTSGVQVGVTVSNLFDENFTEIEGFNMAGRSVMGQVRVSF